MDANLETANPTPGLQRAWTELDVAAYLQCDADELAALRSVDPTFPPPRTLPFGERWVPEFVVGWFSRREVGTATHTPAVAAPRKGARRG